MKTLVGCIGKGLETFSLFYMKTVMGSQHIKRVCCQKNGITIFSNVLEVRAIYLPKDIYKNPVKMSCMIRVDRLKRFGFLESQANFWEL
jgi:hypothetical protein